jgi:hypothetical protein
VSNYLESLAGGFEVRLPQERDPKRISESQPVALEFGRKIAGVPQQVAQNLLGLG